MIDWTQPADLSACSSETRDKILELREIPLRPLDPYVISGMAAQITRKLKGQPSNLYLYMRRLGGAGRATAPSAVKPRRRQRTVVPEFEGRACEWTTCEAVLERRPAESLRDYGARKYCCTEHSKLARGRASQIRFGKFAPVTAVLLMLAGTAQAHDQNGVDYSSWLRHDGSSCCHSRDCGPAEPCDREDGTQGMRILGHQNCIAITSISTLVPPCIGDQTNNCNPNGGFHACIAGGNYDIPAAVMICHGEGAQE